MRGTDKTSEGRWSELRISLIGVDCCKHVENLDLGRNSCKSERDSNREKICDVILSIT